MYIGNRNGKTPGGTVERILYVVNGNVKKGDSEQFRNGKMRHKRGTVKRILYVVNGNVKKGDSGRLNGNTVHHILYVGNRNGKMRH